MKNVAKKGGAHMQCSGDYDELMSLKLDGLIQTDDDNKLHEHIQSCADCGLLWAAMQQANSIMVASALEPLPVPSDFHAKVMMRIAVSAPAEVLQLDPVFQPGMGMVPALQVVPAATRRLEESPTGYLTGYAEWQRRIATYVRGMAAVGLSIAGTVGLLLALVLSGTIKLTGPDGDFVGTLRTFFEAVDTWVRSLFVGFGPGLAVVGLLMTGILVMVGWQVVSSYHRSALETRPSTGVLEAVA
jgi:hypothetical protein